MQYFDLLRSTMIKYDIPVHHIYNMDETGFVFGQAQRQKVFVRRERKSATYFRTQCYDLPLYYYYYSKINYATEAGSLCASVPGTNNRM